MGKTGAKIGLAPSKNYPLTNVILSGSGNSLI